MHRGVSKRHHLGTAFLICWLPALWYEERLLDTSQAPNIAMRSTLSRQVGVALRRRATWVASSERHRGRASTVYESPTG